MKVKKSKRRKFVSNNIKQFAEQYRLKTVKDECDDTVIKGRLGHSHIYEYDADKFGVLIMPDTNTVNRWNKARTAFEAGGYGNSTSGRYGRGGDI